MADTTFISGVADGAFEKAFGELPEWASEETALAIENTLNKILGIQSKTFAQLLKTATAGGTGLSAKDVEDTNKELVKLSRQTNKLNEENTKKLKLDKKEADLKKDNLKNWAKDTFSMKSMMGDLVIAGAAIQKVFMSNVSTFDQLYSSGINVMSGFDGAANGFEALQQLTTLTGVRFTELSATIVKYNTAINSFGLGKFAKTLDAARPSLTQFGYSAKESADLLGVYLQSQQGYSDVNSKTQEQVQKDLVKFGERVTRVSQATGILRSKLLENIDAISQSVDMNLLANRIGDAGAASTSEFIASFKDKKLGQAFLSMMTDTIKPLNSTFMDFQKTGFGGFGQKLMNFTQSLEGLSPEEAAKRTAEFAKANDAELKMMVSRGKLLSQAGVKEADGMMQVAVGLQQQGRTYKEVSKADQAKADATAKASKDLQNQWEKLMATLQAAFAPTIPMLQSLAEGLKWITTKFSELTAAFDPSTRALIGAGAIIVGIIAGLKLTSALMGSIPSLIKTMFGGGQRGSRTNPMYVVDIGSSGGMPGMDKGGKGGKGGKGKWAGRAASVGKGLAGGVGGILAGIGLDYATDELKKSGHNQAAAATDIASSAASFAGTGALLGSFIGPIGTLAGAIIGGGTGALYGAYNNWETISPSTPKSSTIDSPSASKPTDALDNKPGSDTSTTTGESATNKSSRSNEINSTLTYQTAILTQILEASQNLVSVNRDILKYAKVHS